MAARPSLEFIKKHVEEIQSRKLGWKKSWRDSYGRVGVVQGRCVFLWVNSATVEGTKSTNAQRIRDSADPKIARPEKSPHQSEQAAVHEPPILQMMLPE